MSTRNISWGLRRSVCKADSLTTFMCGPSRNLGASTSWNPMDLKQACTGIALLLYLRRYVLIHFMIYIYVCVCVCIFVIMSVYVEISVHKIFIISHYFLQLYLSTELHVNDYWSVIYKNYVSYVVYIVIIILCTCMLQYISISCCFM